MKTICVYCGSNLGNRPVYGERAAELGTRLAREGLTVVYGGGNVGLMGITADSVLAAGGQVVGVIPHALKQRELAHQGLTELLVVDDMHERKALMADRADAFITLPGGYGTLEELFEALAWSQLGIHQKPVGLLNTAGYFDHLLAFLDHAVADYTWALLLGAARRISEGQHSVTRGSWEPVWGQDIHHRTLGIIGCGRIGLEVARRAAGFQMRVIAFDPFPSEAAREAGVEFVDLETLLAESDFVSVNAAATPENRNLINEAALRQMKPTAILINTGRGSLIDEAAMVRALEGGWIGGAALDAFAEEPLPADHPLRSVPNALLCPHMAPFARGTGQELNAGVAQSVLDLMAGKKPKLVVNPEVFDSTNLRASMEVPA